MMSGFSKRIYKGREVIYFNYAGLSEQQAVDALKEAEKVILADGKEYITLTNFTDGFATKGVMAQSMILAKNTMHLAKKGAIVGADGAKSILLKGYNRDLESAGLKSFADEESALEYLIK
jgi:hypothetical protein